MSPRQSTQRTPPSRAVSYLSIIPVYEAPRDLRTPDEAIAFLTGYREPTPSPPFVRYEVSVRYNKGDQVRGDFQEKGAAISFLRAMS